VAQRVGRGIALLFHDRALEGGEWSAARPGRSLPLERTRFPFYRRLGELQGRSGRAENLVPTGIRSRTVQPVAQSLYRLNYPAHTILYYNIIVLWDHRCICGPSFTETSFCVSYLYMHVCTGLRRSILTLKATR